VKKLKVKNPLIPLDYPDPDIIRVGNIYYMVTTTMHFMPGCEILCSNDLVHWKHASYVFLTLDGTEEQKLEGNKHIYGKGMWAASIRYYKKKFYILFAANDTGKTYLYTSDTIDGEWKKSIIDGFYHDASLLFDDNQVYVVYGNKEIWITELKKDLTGPKENGLNRVIVSDKANPQLGYEGAHFYKINGKYYLFLIHSRKDRWMRVQACFVSETLSGEFKGKDVLEDDRNYFDQGIAQGGIVDTPFGEWYAVLFQDHGAVGRLPILVPISWENKFPVFGIDGKVPEIVEVRAPEVDVHYDFLIGSDDFSLPTTNYFGLAPKWQFNHEPKIDFIEIDHENGELIIENPSISASLTQAPNVITQRMLFPSSSAEVLLNASDLKEGDIAGISAFQGEYGWIGITKEDDDYYIVMCSKEKSELRNEKCYKVPFNKSEVKLKVKADFQNMKDTVCFYYKEKNAKDYKKLGIDHKLVFKLDHFTGCRYGLFSYATKKVGGKAKFSRFIYNKGKQSN
jgi:beta-xylosidase